MAEFIITYDLIGATAEQRLAFHVGHWRVRDPRRAQVEIRLACICRRSDRRACQRVDQDTRSLKSKLGVSFVRDTLQMIVALADEDSKSIVEYRTKVLETRPLHPRRR